MAACKILLFIVLDELINIFVSFGRQCPPIPSLGSSMSTFHLVLSDSRSSEKLIPFDLQ